MSAPIDERPASQSCKGTDIFWPSTRMTADEATERDHDVIELAIRLGLIALLIYWTFAWSVTMVVALYPAFGWLASALRGDDHTFKPSVRRRPGHLARR